MPSLDEKRKELKRLALIAKIRAGIAAQEDPPPAPLSSRRQQVFDALGKVASKEDPNALINLPKDPNDTVFGRFERENLPAIGATVATLARRGRPAPKSPPGRLPTNIIEALNRVVVRPGAEVAKGAGRAALGGGLGGLAQEGTETPVLDRFVNNAIEQGVADPLSRLTLGLGKFFLRPATKVTAQSIERAMSFIRSEGLPLDPGKITGETIPKVLSTFARNFAGSAAQSRAKMRSIVELISSNPENGKAVIRHILKEGPGLPRAGATGQFLLDTQKAVVAMGGRLKGRATKQMQKAFGADDAGKAAEIIFRDAATAAQAKANMTRKAWNNLVTSHIDNMIKRSSVDGIIDGDILGGIIRENRTNLSQFYPKDLLSRLENLAIYAKAHKSVPAEILESEFLNPKAAATNLALGGVAMVDPTQVSMGVIGLSTIFASQMFNPNSILSKWLTTGLMPKSVLTKLGAEVLANVATRETIGDAVTNTGTTQAIRERDLRPIQDKVGGFVNRQVQRFQ